MVIYSKHVIYWLERNYPINFGCCCVYDFSIAWRYILPYFTSHSQRSKLPWSQKVKSEQNCSRISGRESHSPWYLLSHFEFTTSGAIVHHFPLGSTRLPVDQTKHREREREAKPKISAHISAEIFMLNHNNFCLISRNIAPGAALWRKTFPSSHTHTYAHVFYLPQEPYINLPIFFTQHRVRDQKSWNFYANFSSNLNKQITKRRRRTLRRWSRRMGRENQE